MKKFLLALMAVAALSTSAQTLDKTNVLYAPSHQDAPAQAPSRAADGYTIRFCGDIYSWLGLKAAGTYVQYITIPAEIATQLAGNKVTSISYSICLGGSNASASKAGTIFVTEDPEVTALADLVLAAQASVKIRDSYLVDPGYQTGTFAAGEEYVIKENTPFSFGLMYDCAASDYPVGVDGESPNQFCGTACLYQNGNRTAYYPMDYAAGTNIMMYAVTKGEKTELLDLASVQGVTLNSFTLPVFNSSTELPLNVAINNLGSNAITSMAYSYKFGDGAYSSGEAEINVAAGKAEWVDLQLEGMPVGHNTLTFKVDKLNGKDASGEEWLTNYFNLGDVEGYDRKFVVEEGTGTWCGWCPRGIVGMDYMQETYPEKFVGIAVHSGDKFEVSNYGEFINKFFSSFPSCAINRDPVFSGDPSSAYLDYAYQWWLEQKSPAEVNFTEYKVVDKNLEVKANVTFAVNDNHAYDIAIVLTEDGLTGVQTNYYAGGDNGKMGGWESKASKVSWTYTHTAVAIDKSFGNELATAVEAGHTYEATASFQYIGAMNKKKFNLENTHAVALLFDAETGVVLNAAKISLADTDGINDAIALPVEEAEYYNIQGLKVANPLPGQLYIRVQGDKATKIVY